MGSPQDEPGRQFNEGQVKVTLSQPFLMGKYEVTQAEFGKLWKAAVAGGRICNARGVLTGK